MYSPIVFEKMVYKHSLYKDLIFIFHLLPYSLRRLSSSIQAIINYHRPGNNNGHLFLMIREARKLKTGGGGLCGNWLSRRVRIILPRYDLLWEER